VNPLVGGSPSPLGGISRARQGGRSHLPTTSTASAGKRHDDHVVQWAACSQSQFGRQETNLTGLHCECSTRRKETRLAGKKKGKKGKKGK
jgi:hypothetical protein